MKKLLIIEDNSYLREEVSDWFKFEGYECISAKNGREGIFLAVKHIPDLILCDIMMPEIDGQQVLSVIRKNPLTQFIPFLFILIFPYDHNG